MLYIAKDTNKKMHQNGSSTEAEETSFQQDHPSQLWEGCFDLSRSSLRTRDVESLPGKTGKKKHRLTGLALKLYNVHIWWGREIIKQCPLWARERVWHFYDWFLVADSASATPPLCSAASDGRFSLARLQDVVAAARLSLQVLRKHTGANLVAIHFAARNSTSIQKKKKSREQTCIHIHALCNSAFCIFGPRHHRHRRFL